MHLIHPVQSSPIQPKTIPPKNTTLNTSVIKPVLRRILHANDPDAGTHGRRIPPRRDDAIHGLQADALDAILRHELQPVHRARLGRAHVRARGRLDVGGLAAEQDLALGAQVEGRRAVGAEEVVAQRRGRGDRRGQRRQGQVHGQRREGVEGCFVGCGERGAVEERRYCAERHGGHGRVQAGVVLDAAAQGDVLEGLAGGRGGGELGCVWGGRALVLGGRWGWEGGGTGETWGRAGEGTYLLRGGELGSVWWEAWEGSLRQGQLGQQVGQEELGQRLLGRELQQRAG